MQEEVISVGIDIGTSTSQLVLSRLVVENIASVFNVPRIKIIDREIIKRSRICFTPIIDGDVIDLERLKYFIDAEYKRLDIKHEEIKTGAVIITGETSRKVNAENVAECLSEFAGDFVVATAGPDLESIISGKGAGADILSDKEHAVVANLDIGGGTTNISVFKNGEVIDVACFDIGGRLIKFDEESRITYIAAKVKVIAEFISVHIVEGETADESKLRLIAEEMAKILEMSLGLREKNELYNILITNHGLSLGYEIDNVSFSGGVADYIYGIQTELMAFNDIGGLLGQSIISSDIFKNLNIKKSNETIRATVIGAGSHTTDISGSTIFYNRDFFPMKNIPIIKISIDEECSDKIADAVKKKVDWFKTHNDFQQIAVAFTGGTDHSFKYIRKLSRNLIDGLGELILNKFKVIVLVESDIAKVLGQTLYTELDFNSDVLCIDSITVNNGNYIDIGKPIANGNVLPVVVKTLVFEKNK